MPPDLTFISSNYPRFEHGFMVPKVFEPMKIYCHSQTLDVASLILLPRMAY